MIGLVIKSHRISAQPIEPAAPRDEKAAVTSHANRSHCRALAQERSQIGQLPVAADVEAVDALLVGRSERSGDVEESALIEIEVGRSNFIVLCDLCQGASADFR